MLHRFLRKITNWTERRRGATSFPELKICSKGSSTYFPEKRSIFWQYRYWLLFLLGLQYSRSTWPPLLSQELASIQLGVSELQPSTTGTMLGITNGSSEWDPSLELLLLLFIIRSSEPFHSRPELKLFPLPFFSSFAWVVVFGLAVAFFLCYLDVNSVLIVIDLLYWSV